MAGAATALVALVAACGADTGADKGALKLQLFGDAEELEIYSELVDAYEKETGNEVRLVAVPDRDAHHQKLTTAFGAKRPPEVFLVNYRNFAGFASKGVLEPAGPKLDRSRKLDRNDFYEAPLEAFEYEGELQCMPQNVSSLVTYYNKDLFREAGVPEPRDDWTLDDLRDTAARLKGKIGQADALGVEPVMVRAAPFVWAAGGELVDDYDNPTRWTMDTPAAKAGLRDLLELVDYGPGELEARAKSLEDRFIAGELAMVMGSRAEVPNFRTIEDFDWDVAPFPAGRQRASILHSDAYCVSKGARSDEAWDFVEFAVGEQGARITARGGRTVPSMKKVATSQDFLDTSRKPASSKVFIDAVGSIHRLPTSPDWPRLESGADIAVEEAFYKRLGPEGVNTRLHKETKAILR